MHSRLNREGGSYVWAATQAFPQGWPAVTVPEAIEVRHLRTAGNGPEPPPPLYTWNPTLRPNLNESSTLAPKQRTLCPSFTVTETDPYAPAPSPRDASSRRRISPAARDFTLVVPFSAQLPAGLFLKPLKLSHLITR